MDTLLIVGVVVIALAVVTQAGMLIAMYLMSRRVTGKVETLMDESRRLMAPLESVTNNLNAVSNDIARPIRQYSAIALAIAEGVRTFFRGGREEVQEEINIEIKEERPAA